MTMSTSGTISRQPVDRLMTASNQIFLVMDAGSPKAAFTTRGKVQASLRRVTQLIIDGCREGRLIVGDGSAGGRGKPLELN